MQSQGRYDDDLPFDFMARMGIWFENYALPVVINECLLQSYNGIIRFFPNWPLEKRVAFHQLRTVGAFLVRARCSAGCVTGFEILSERGGELRFYNPWKSCSIDGNETSSERIVSVTTRQGQCLTFRPDSSCAGE